MNYLLLIGAVFILLFALRRMSMIKFSNVHSALKEIRQNVLSLLWGVFAISAIVFIPYQVWLLAGSSDDWNGAYIIGGTTLLTIIGSFVFYYKSASKFS